MSLTGNAKSSVLRGKINACDVLTLSAYAIAVKHGFEGTEEEWLASLKGEKGDPGDFENEGEFDMVNGRIVNLGEPVRDNDAATKKYVDAVEEAKANKGSTLQFLNEYNSALKNEIVECALTYYRNADRLYYGNESIATSLDANRLTPLYYYDTDASVYRWTALERRVADDGTASYYYLFTDTEYNNGNDDKETALGKMFTCSAADVEAYMEQARAMADSIVCQIDCSSFVNLVLAGIPYEYSRYAKWMNTDGDTDNVPFYEWGYVWDEDEQEKYYVNRGRLGAANLAQYCYDKGYGIEVTDWKKFQTGDLIFQTDPDSTTTAFRKITHVLIYLCPSTVGSADEEDHWFIDVSTMDETKATAPVSIKRIGKVTLSGEYSTVIYAGRLPITLNRETHPGNLVTRTSQVLPYTVADADQRNLMYAYLREPLKKDAFYTVVVDIDVGDTFTEDNVNPEVGLLYNGAYSAGRKKVSTNRSRNLYSFTLIQGQTSYSDDTNYLTLFTSQQDNSTAAHHVRTVVRGIAVYESIFPYFGTAPIGDTLFTVGVTVPATGDANTLTQPGKYLVVNGCANMPEDAPAASADMVVIPQTSGYVKQIAVYTATDLIDAMYARMVNTASGDVGVWHKFGGVSMAKLWENSAPTSEVEDETVIDIDLSSYQAVLLVCRVSTTNSRMLSATIPVGLAGRVISLDGGKFSCRDFQTLTTGVRVYNSGKASTYGATTADTSIVIPYRIYGIKGVR